MKLFAGIVVLASFMPYLVCGDSAVAAAAASSRDGAAASAAAATTTYSQPEYPPTRCICSANYEPVCGADGNTYTNDCWLACANQRRAYRGACSNLPCKCPNLIIPVCGTDGKTYRNACILRCLNADEKPPVYVAEPGACKIEKCYCSKQKDEICATDKRTYYNRCFLNCQNRRLVQLGEKPLTIKHNGPCPCVCPKILDPVCANNDVTFPNECLFLCEKARDNKLFIRWKGNCNCGCTNEYDPYCTLEGRTIPNGCLVRCENSKRRQDGLGPLIVTRGECKRCRCDYCPLVEQPVCDKYGKMYRNMCYFNCNNDCRKKAGLDLLCLGKCY